MVKAGYQVMRAVQEFLKEQKMAEIEGWVVSGASKRGWTTWDVGATDCKTCPAKILAITPLVPIVPNIIDEVHRQWRSYNGFTLEFEDYTALNITERMDSPRMHQI
jgi:PhoPQ-activated pathogenicity-related protein